MDIMRYIGTYDKHRSIFNPNSFRACDRDLRVLMKQRTGGSITSPKRRRIEKIVLVFTQTKRETRCQSPLVTGLAGLEQMVSFLLS